MNRVLVTGGSGFLGSHAIVQLLTAGFDVRTTLRNMVRKDEVEAMVRAGGADPRRMEFVVADLEQDEGWPAAVADCDYVLHVASPFPSGQPKDEGDLIRPARDGALRVLRAARDARTKRVVMTSSFAAVGYGHPMRQTPFTEVDWSRPEAPDIQPYIKSKMVAERAAWGFIEAEGGELELSVINPVGIFGPVLGPDYASSVAIIKAMLDGQMPFAPRVSFGMTDVRDVAALHILAMTSPKAVGERFIAVSGEPISMLEVARILRRELGAAAAKAPVRQMPDWLVRLMSRVVPKLRNVVPQLGIVRRASNQKSRDVLGWQPRQTEQIVIDTAESLLSIARIGQGPPAGLVAGPAVKSFQGPSGP